MRLRQAGHAFSILPLELSRPLPLVLARSELGQSVDQRQEADPRLLTHLRVHAADDASTSIGPDAGDIDLDVGEMEWF